MSEEGGDAVVDVPADEPATEVKEKKPAAKKAKAAKKPKAKSADTHPKYSQMISEAIGALKERNGSSRQAILKYIMANYRVDKDERVVNNHLKMSLRAGVKNGAVKQLKGVGASGSFKLGDKATKAEKKKPAAKKAATPKQKAKPSSKSLSKVKKPKAAASKTKKSPKKAKTPAKTSEKKSAKKSPKKAAKKTAKKSPKKGKKGKGKAAKPAAEATKADSGDASE